MKPAIQSDIHYGGDWVTVYPSAPDITHCEQHPEFHEVVCFTSVGTGHHYSLDHSGWDDFYSVYSGIASLVMTVALLLVVGTGIVGGWSYLIREEPKKGKK